MKPIPYGRQHIDASDIDRVVEVLHGDWLTGGPTVAQFEDALASYCGAKHVIAVSNGTAALHVAMMAAGIGPGDRVVTTPNTFLASANCAEYVGAETYFSDIHPTSYNLDTPTLEQNWQPGTRAVVAVDFAGLPCDMPAIHGIAKAQGALVIEDASHAIGSRFTVAGESFRVGGHPWADLTTFSFHPVKTMATGEGGAIATDNDDLAAACRLLRNHGMSKNRPGEPWHYEMEQLGFNYRITDLQCALGLSQLQRIETFIDRRQAIADQYQSAFAAIDWLTLPRSEPSGTFAPERVARHLYVVQMDFRQLGRSRAEIMGDLLEKGVGTQVHYIPVSSQPYYQNKYGFRAKDLPVAYAYYDHCLSLPLFPDMSDEDVQHVIDAVQGLAS